MTSKKLLLLAILLALIGSFFTFNLGQYFSLEALLGQREALAAYQGEHPAQAAVLYFMIYVAVTALSLPGAAIMTLAGGALFGLLQGLILVSFASTIGATLAFLVSRTLLRDVVQQRFGESLKAINAGISNEGAYYLFGLRLVPLFPFFVINLVIGLTPMRARQFFWVSQLGMLPGTLVYVNAGTQLGQITSLSGILSPGLIGSFVLLGLFPLLAKKLLNALHARRVYRGYTKPRQFDNNLLVIGAGSAGLVTSYIAAAVKARVTLIERHRMGGDCLNTGCVPSKALIRSARIADYCRRAAEFGIKVDGSSVDFKTVMERVNRVVATVEPHDSVERYSRLGVTCLNGDARLVDPWRVEVNGQTLSARHIVIATGARPFVPDIPGLDTLSYLTSDTVWSLRDKPQSMLVIGGGPIGCELAQSFHRLGVPVIQLDRGPRLLPREDADVAHEVQQRFVADGIDLRLGAKPVRFEPRGAQNVLIYEQAGAMHELVFDRLLLAVGRRANTDGLGLSELGIPLNPNGTIRTNDWLQTEVPNISACGDVAGPYQFTHMAAHQAWYAAVNSLFGGLKRFKVDYRVVPWCTFTDPEVARVGLNEQEAKAQDVAYEVTRFGIDDLDRAIADSEAHGFIKVLTVPGKDTILGVTIVGYHAGELIAEYVMAMKHKLGLNKVLGTIHIYPTLTESNKYVAGEWKRAHAPAGILRWLERFHAWQRH